VNCDEWRVPALLLPRFHGSEGHKLRLNTVIRERRRVTETPGRRSASL
jgi:hypothetical protein